MYGTAIHTEYMRHNGIPQSVIGYVSTSPSGNVIIAVGRREVGAPGWTKTEHIVLEKAEAESFIADLSKALGQ